MLVRPGYYCETQHCRSQDGLDSFNISPVRPCWQAYISEVHPSASRWLSAGFAVRFVGSFSFGSARVSVVGGFSPPVLGRWYETLAIGGSANVTAVLGDGSGEPGDGDGGSTVTTSTSSRAWSLNLTVCLAVDFFFTFTGEPARRWGFGKGGWIRFLLYWLKRLSESKLPEVDRVESSGWSMSVHVLVAYK
uniref:Uncharacterized protein n=1 Tax=Anopheles coluzzii TaxID=1518534 RepID=A0A8W7PP64_ANOCL